MKKLLPLTLLLFFTTTFTLETSITEEIDCSDITIELDTDANDVVEKLRKMDDAFYDSLSQFEQCSENSSASSSSAAKAAEGASSAANLPSKGISGTENSLKNNLNGRPTSLVSDPAGVANSEISAQTIESQNKINDNGKLPEDIPLMDNDSIVEVQLRDAAIAETDLQKKKKLWNEYRRYKGLAEK